MYEVRVTQHWKDWEHEYIFTAENGEMDSFQNLESAIQYYELEDNDHVDFYDIVDKDKTHKGYKVRLRIDDEKFIKDKTKNVLSRGDKKAVMLYASRYKSRFTKDLTYLDGEGIPQIRKALYKVTRNKLKKGQLLNQTLTAKNGSARVQFTLLESMDLTITKMKNGR